MKNYILLLFTLLLSGSLLGSISCDVQICLDSNVENIDSMEIGFKKQKFVLDGSNTCETIQVDCASKYFYLSVNGGFSTVVHKKPKLMLSVEDEMVKVSDDLVNSFLLNRYSTFTNYSVDWDLPVEEYYKVIDGNLKENKALIKKTLSESSPDLEVIRNEMVMVEKMIASHYLSNYMNINRRKNPELEVDLMRYLTNQNLRDTKYEFNVNNLNFQYNLFMDSIIGGMPDEDYPYKVFELLNESINLSKVKRTIADRVLLSSAKDSTINMDSLVGLYITNIGEIRKGSRVDKTLKGSYGIKNGEPIPSFSNLEDVDGKRYSKQDLLGKNIVLMTWGTWCPYCAEEFEYIKPLQAKYPDVTFVFVSFDKQKMKWTEKLQMLGLEGIHLIDTETSSSFKQNFMVNTTNRYFLIDKAGILLESQNLSPSKGLLENKIKELF